MKSVSVEELLSSDAKHLKLKLLYGKKLVKIKKINNFRIQKPGLGLAGYVEHIHEGRVQILGNTEISYLWSLDSKQRLYFLSKLCDKKISCFIITKNLHAPSELFSTVKAYGIPLLKTEIISSEFIEKISFFLENKLCPETIEHGVFMDVYGIGILIIGRSGIGKSECALELIKRGHRLVADDAVHIKRIHGELIGSSNDLLRYNLEIRGLGILNIKNMYGVSSIRTEKKLEIVVNFKDWNNDEDYDRLGLDENFYEILNIQLPKIILPISPGRNIAVIIEGAAKNHMLKIMGYDSAKEMTEKLKIQISKNMNTKDSFNV
jgi:HPr kinase/phosphorylase